MANGSDRLARVLEHLDLNHERALAELIELASIPSVSTDPAHASDIVRAAKWVEQALSAAGPFSIRTISTPRNPIVYAEWLGAPGRPTVLVYGHYDVQPPDPLEKWHSQPFTPSIRDGRLYARGVSDDKGPMLIPIKVAQAFFAVAGKLPINVKCLFEGEEEISSPSLEVFIRDNTQLLAADVVLSADGAMWRIQEPSLTVASRGITGLEITLTAASKDLHSGRHGGAVANPLHAMAQLVASLHRDDGRVAVAGFYDAVRALSPGERAEIAALPFDDATYLTQVGAPSTFGESGFSTLERQWARPTLEVNGMWGGYEGPGQKTVIPSEAHAKITCRLVPDQDPDDILRLVTRHLEGNAPPGTRLTISPNDHGARPYRIAPDHFGLQAAAAALRDVYSVSPAIVRMGGTVPISELFKRHMDLETVFFSFSTADEDFHAPNEFFRINRLREGAHAWARCWEHLAQHRQLSDAHDGAHARAQPFTPGDTGGSTMHVEIKEMPTRRLGTIRHVGPYNQVGEAFQRLGAIAATSGLFRPGAEMLALYHDDPEATPSDQLRSDAGITVSDDLALPSGLAEQRVAAGTYACTVHIGPYDRLPDTWARLKGEWLPASDHRVGPGASYEIYLNNPMNTPKEKLETEICIPLLGR